MTEQEQSTLDIDWFFTNGSLIGFVASGGGKLPRSVSNFKENIDVLSNYFRNLPDRCEVVKNPDLINTPRGTDKYFEDFVFLGKKGLYTFDKTVFGDFNNDEYHLVCSPQNPITIEELAYDIVNLVEQTKLQGDIYNSIKIGTDF